ncbi:MAG: hypothetical protein KBB94_08500 [Legionellaceae bacterium]|nr:hypothetical protein [Legionellaceae bacterium]MBP9776076.1 hypothetical protein [Legionellaceae bacterium]
MKPLLYLSVLVLSSSVFAITSLPPTGESALDLDAEPVYYPPQKTNTPINPQVEQQSDPETSTPTT